MGDVGAVGGYHVGDEAMLDAAITNLRSRGVTDLVVVSGDENDTAQRYDVRAINNIGFPARGASHDETRDEWLAAISSLVEKPADRAAVAGLIGADATARAERVIDAVRRSSGVVIAGGGNMSASWPDHLYERVALLKIARAVGVPAVVSSQTIGPHLSERHADLLAEALPACALVGLRELQSLELVDRLAPTANRCLQLDDAVFRATDSAVIGSSVEPFIAVTINSFADDSRSAELLQSYCDLMRHLHAVSGLRVLFIPHLGPTGVDDEGDLAVAGCLRSQLSDFAAFDVAPLMPAREAAALTAQAAVVVSTRYHPIVFGLSAAIPCLAITQDHYTAVKLHGAMRHAGVSWWSTTTEGLLAGVAIDLFDELWARRPELKHHLTQTTESWQRRCLQHWDDVVQMLNEPASTAVDSNAEASATELYPRFADAAKIRLVADLMGKRVAEVEYLAEVNFQRAEQYALSLAKILEARDDEIAHLRQQITPL